MAGIDAADPTLLSTTSAVGRDSNTRGIALSGVRSNLDAR
jgi:hypothetical protein